jgi:2-polyprenyl-3-methyl-5-hydroxy-6-metoxy-1,4-benzoquinol methylase
MPLLSNVLWTNREDALSSPRGDIFLVYCETCGHVFNQSFDPNLLEYDVQYENSLHFSQHFQQYASGLAQHLIERYGLHEKRIIEIGSGKGEFLSMLCEYGDNSGTGFDPSYQPPSQPEPGKLSFVKDIYSEKYASYQADLILSRHVLEHIYQPANFIQNLQKAMSNQKEVVVFCEVPNFRYILRDTAIWDIIYEHYSYFCAQSLAEIFTRHNFSVLNVEEVFHDQFIYIEAVPKRSDHPSIPVIETLPIEVLANKVASFNEHSQAKLSYWNERIDALRAQGKNAVLWGAGSKGISFLNMLPVENVIEYVVDINPRKNGKFITGAGQQIVPPEYLQTYKPDFIIIMNPAYQYEIKDRIDQLGINPEFLLAS